MTAVVVLQYHPNKENYQINSEKIFFGTVTGDQSPNNSRRTFCRYRYFFLPTQILGNLFLPARFKSKIRIITVFIPIDKREDS